MSDESKFPKINYVIATYSGYNKRKDEFPLKENVLSDHLECVIKFKSPETTVTIMKAECKGRTIKGYYRDEKKADNIHECENYGFSNGQWLKCYEIYKDSFDYYIFIEDDYCPNKHNFDRILVKKYEEKFPDKRGFLCNLVQEGIFPVHYEGVACLSKETLDELYTCHKWEGKPRDYLDLIDEKIDDSFNWKNIKTQYIGAYYQLTFSSLFRLIGIKHEDFLDDDVLFPYWSDASGIIIYKKGEKIVKKYGLKKILKSIILPIQLIKKEYISKNLLK